MGVTFLAQGSIDEIAGDNPGQYSEPGVLKPENHLEGLLKCRWMNPFPRASDSVALGWGHLIGISNKFSDGSGMLVQGPHFETHCFKHSTGHIVIALKKKKVCFY